MVSCLNTNAQYEIIGRIPKGTTIEAYMVRDRLNNVIGRMSKSNAEEFALAKKIYNVSAQRYGDLVNLKGINCKISKLPNYTMDGQIIEDENANKKVADLKLVGKVMSGRTIVYYVAVSVMEPDKLIKIARDKTIELAQDGRIINVKTQNNGNKVILRAKDGKSLAGLRNYNN